MPRILVFCKDRPALTERTSVKYTTQKAITLRGSDYTFPALGKSHRTVVLIKIVFVHQKVSFPCYVHSSRNRTVESIGLQIIRIQMQRKTLFYVQRSGSWTFRRTVSSFVSESQPGTTRSSGCYSISILLAACLEPF